MIKEKECFVYVVKGTPIFFLPEEIRNKLEIELASEMPTETERKFFKKFGIKEWDKWRVTGAKAGFTSRSYLRLNIPKTDRPVVWNKNTDLVYGVSDYISVIRFNYRLCAKCGKVKGEFTGEFNYIDEFRVIIEFKCLNCRNEWSIEKTMGRKQFKKEKVAVGPSAKPPFYKRFKHKGFKNFSQN